MRGLISVYLDSFRFLAALGVFLWHEELHNDGSGILPHIFFSHKLVVIFFVISGYVIAASADRPDRTLVNYSADRLARLSSVVIPALLLTYGLDAIGSRVSPELYSSLNPQWQPIRLLLNLFYCQQIWFLCVNPSSNAPFWSLGYEFWYYVLFGTWVFVKTKWTKALLLLAVSLFVGPKILLLLPAWAVGAAAFHLSKTWRCSYLNSWIFFIVTGLVTVTALIFEDQLGLNNGKAGLAPLYYSSNFLGDNIFALILAAHFFCCSLLSQQSSKNIESYRMIRFIRWMAGHTFSLYVYHLPILLCICAIAKHDPHNFMAVLANTMLTLLIVVVLSKATEEKYPIVRKIFRRWMQSFDGKMRLVTTRWKFIFKPQNTKPTCT
jgi:peptidoglycan/LPS O-acetylase OafA/YrhL